MAPVGSGGDGPLTTIAEHDQPTPDGDATFHSFADVAIDGDLIVFTAFLDSPGEELTTGLYGWKDGTLFTIIENDEELFGEDTIDFTMTNRSLDGNQLVFRARYFDPDAPFEQGLGVYVVTIGDSLVAELDSLEVVAGSLLSGSIEDLVNSDDSSVHTRSEPGFTAFEPNLMDTVIGVVSPTESGDANAIGLTIESRINHPVGEAKVRLRDWSTGEFEQVDSYEIGTTEEIVTISGVDATNHIRPDDSRIDLSLRHVVIATFTASGFDSFVDHIEVAVQ